MEAIKSEFEDFWQSHEYPYKSAYAKVIPIERTSKGYGLSNKKLSLGVLLWRWFWVVSVSVVAAIIVVLGLRAGILALVSSPVPTKHLTYLVQPGDSLWSIARKIEPHSDPRRLVYNLDSQLHGARIYPGEKIKISY